ncbi:MAG: acylneuraminate cytidylyltransferase family protein [Bacteroidales bacterium]|nr:acylneuraminate cytidylyltransferase family protein [Bacteroidales bacterium]
MKILYVIPARGGSKGIPHKNIINLGGKPLICYSIDVARSLTTDENICVSTDDDEIIRVVEDYGLAVPFKRPDALATDHATTNDVLVHAVDFYENQGRNYDLLVLLQPTSPFRTSKQIKQALELYREDLEMVVSVKQSHCASVLCHENETGFLELTINKNADRRQECENYFEYNGAIYVIDIKSLKSTGLGRMTKKLKFVMDEESSLDIDTPFDWEMAECLMNKRK